MFTVENGSSIQFWMTMIIVIVCSICLGNAKDVPHHPLSVCRMVWGYFISFWCAMGKASNSYGAIVKLEILKRLDRNNQIF